MGLATHIDYLTFLNSHSEVEIENVKVELKGKWRIKEYSPPADYKPEAWTVWSFPDRGDWATHVGNYRGNWSPYIPRNLILHYTKKKDLVLDQMMGSGTTLVECKLLGRNAIGVDINRDAAMVALDRLNFSVPSLDMKEQKPEIKTYLGDARNLDKVPDESVDLIATHPPYAGIISYSRSKVEGDLSSFSSLDKFLEEMKIVADESFRVLKPGKHCGILIGDTRKHQHYIPISVRVLQKFLEAGFILREDIIKLQHKTKSTRENWSGGKYDFYKIAHEHLYIFRKPAEGESKTKFKNSLKWWD
jgi:DNA modification methylase